MPILVAFLTSHAAQGIWALGYVLVYQQIENYLLSPQTDREDDGAASGGRVRARR